MATSAAGNNQMHHPMTWVIIVSVPLLALVQLKFMAGQAWVVVVLRFADRSSFFLMEVMVCCVRRHDECI